MKVDQNGFKYLEVEEAEQLQNRLEQVLQEFGLDEKVSFHPDHLRVPTEQSQRQIYM